MLSDACFDFIYDENQDRAFADFVHDLDWYDCTFDYGPALIEFLRTAVLAVQQAPAGKEKDDALVELLLRAEVSSRNSTRRPPSPRWKNSLTALALASTKGA